MRSYYEATNKKSGVVIPLASPVLPMIFHEQTVLSISQRSFKGGLFRAVAEDRMLGVGLQERMEAMTSQTFDSINVAFASGLIRYDKDTGQLFPSRLTEPFQVQIGENRKMLHAAKRLGIWFATIDLEQLSILLKVRL